MAVTSCTLIGHGLPATFTMDRARSYQLKYHIKTNSLMGPISLYFGALLAAPDPLPDLWDPYTCRGDTDADARCAKLVTKQLSEKTPYAFEALCDFATLPRGMDASQANVNPFARGVRYGGAKLVRTRAVTSDKDGKPLTTSAKEEFDESLEEDVVYAVLVAKRYVATLDAWVADMATYINSVNSTTYRGQTARKWWCMDVGISDLISESGNAFYEETWQLALNLGTWDEELLDRGWKILDGDPPNQKQINATDADGKGLTAPVLLDGTGKKLAIGAEPVARKFRVKREVNWSTIPV